MKMVRLLGIFLCFYSNIVFANKNVYALIIGMDKINDDNYLHQYKKSYNASAVTGVWKDVEAVKSMVGSNASLIELRAENATHDAILNEFKRIGHVIQPSDLFIFYYSGHGDVIPDLNHDEQSGYDQVLVAYDKYVIDDEIDIILRQFFSKAINCFIIDGCHSGTTYKMPSLYLDFKKAYNKEGQIVFESEKLINKQAQDFTSCNFPSPVPEQYQLIYFGATADDTLAFGSSTGGLLTQTMLNIIKTAKAIGQWNNYSYRRLACMLKDRMNNFSQILQYHEIGLGTDELAIRTPFKNY